MTVQSPSGFPAMAPTIRFDAQDGDAVLRAALYQACLAHVTDDFSHELRGALHTLVVNLDLLGGDVERGSESDAKRHLERVSQAFELHNDRLEVFLEALRTQEEGDPSFDWSEAVRKAAALLAPFSRRRRRPLEVSLAPACRVVGDREALRQALFVALVSALEASSDEHPTHLRLTAAESRAALEIELEPDETRGAKWGSQRDLLELPEIRVARTTFQSLGGAFEASLRGRETTLRFELPLLRSRT
jgi:signal transduction histidine kinase